MKKALLAAAITKIGGTEFADGQKVIKVTLEDGYSFNVPERSPLITKVEEGFELDITYNSDKETEGNPTASGAVFTFHNLSGVKVIAARPGTVDDTLKDLPDVTPRTIEFKKVGGGTTSSDSSAPGKV